MHQEIYMFHGIMINKKLLGINGFPVFRMRIKGCLFKFLC